MKDKNIFVIGAGASREANLPTGEELKQKIIKLLDIDFSFHDQVSGDRIIVKSFEKLVKDINPYLNEAWHIKDALPHAISIDNFIDSQRGNEELAVCGKLAIARSILSAEKDSLLFYRTDNLLSERNKKMNFPSLEKTWYVSFFKLLTENCTKEDLIDRFKSVVLVIFNYDRCVEHYLFNALQVYYQITKDESAEIIKNINIYHPYGSVGFLGWQKKYLTIGFGDIPTPDLLIDCAKRIKTFTESTDPSESEIIAIRDHMANANKLVFLGFAFHKLNMRLISPNVDESKSIPHVFATAYGVSKSDQDVINGQIKVMYRKNLTATSPELHIGMADCDCNSFFSEYWRSLSF